MSCRAVATAAAAGLVLGLMVPLRLIGQFLIVPAVAYLLLVRVRPLGRQVVAAIESLYSDLAERSIAIVCGKGNNGGDGRVAALHLEQLGQRTERPADESLRCSRLHGP